MLCIIKKKHLPPAIAYSVKIGHLFRFKSAALPERSDAGFLVLYKALLRKIGQLKEMPLFCLGDGGKFMVPFESNSDYRKWQKEKNEAFDDLQG